MQHAEAGYFWKDPSNREPACHSIYKFALLLLRLHPKQHPGFSKIFELAYSHLSENLYCNIEIFNFNSEATDLQTVINYTVIAFCMSQHCQYFMPVEQCSTDWLNRLIRVTWEASSPSHILSKYFKNITCLKRNFSNKKEKQKKLFNNIQGCLAFQCLQRC